MLIHLCLIQDIPKDNRYFRLKIWILLENLGHNPQKLVFSIETLCNNT